MIVSLPLTALVFSVILIAQLERQKGQAEAWVDHAIQVRTLLQESFVVMLQAENALRAYVLTHDGAWLREASEISAESARNLDQLAQLVRDDPGLPDRVGRLRTAMQSRMQGVGIANAAPAPGDGKRLSTEVQREYDSLLAAENALFRERTERNRTESAWLHLATAGSLLLGILGGLIQAVLFTSIVKRVKDLEARADDLLLGQSHAPVAPGDDELGRLAQAMAHTATALSERNETLELCLEGARIMVCEVNFGDNTLRYQGGAELLKSTHYPQQLLPKTVEQWMAVIYPEDRERIQAQLRGVLASGGPYEFEYRVLLPDTGEHLWVVARGTQPRAERGQPERLRGVLVDITARKRAEQEVARQAEELKQSQAELQRQTQMLQSVLDSMAEGVVVADRNGQFVVFNAAAARIMQRGPSENGFEQWPDEYGVFLPDMVTPYPSDQLPLVRAMAGEAVDGAEQFVRHTSLPDGTWISVTARPWEDEREIVGGVAVLRDITREKHAAGLLEAAKKEAESASAAKSEFLSRMSHELRTPLNSVLGFAQLLELESLSDEQADNVQHILRSGRLLLDLINEVLDLSRIEAGRLGLSPEPVRMREALRDALDVVRPLAAQQNVNINPDVVLRCDRHVVADRQRLKQVLLNLLANAVKFNRPGGSVRISCEQLPHNCLRVEIADTGRGIRAEDLPKLFQPFERLGAEQEGISGTGLGLALSKRLLEAMGGSIAVDSTEGVGSVFYIDLLEAPDPAATESEDMLGPAAEVRAGGVAGTILYIEDNLSNLRLMERILSRYPEVKLLAAMQGKLGLDLAQAHLPDWILLDVHLPDASGDEVMRQLLENPRTASIPVTVISADATANQVSRLIRSGARDYLTKPLDVRQLLRLMEATLPAVPRSTEEAAAPARPEA